MELVIVAAGISFVAGALGYIIVRFWLVPISRYNKLKRQIASGLSRFAPEGGAKGGKTASPRDLRRLAGQLGDMYYTEMPHWYKMVLANRDESPEDAAKHLNALAGARKKEDAGPRAKQVRASLKLK